MTWVKSKYAWFSYLTMVQSRCMGVSSETEQTVNASGKLK